MYWVGANITTTLLIILDAFNYDYVTSKYTPFLHSLSKDWVFSHMQSSPGFGQRASMFTGTHPEQNKQLFKFYYNPAQSPFRWTKILPKFLSKKYHVDKAVRLIISGLTKSSYRLVTASTFNIPIELLHFFDFVDNKKALEEELKSLPNLMTACSAMHMSYYFIMPPQVKSDSMAIKIISRLMTSNSNKNLSYVLHLSKLDEIGHKFGPNSSFVKMALLQMDHNVEKIMSFFKKDEKLNVVITSDHGMTEVKKIIDISDVLNFVNKNSIPYFLDSTVARFWCKNLRRRQELEDRLSSIGDGKLLTDLDMIERHMFFPDYRYGDVIFWLREGCIIKNNFFQAGDHIKGMHGYLEENQMSSGLFLSNSSEAAKFVEENVFNITNIYPLILSIFNSTTKK